MDYYISTSLLILHFALNHFIVRIKVLVLFHHLSHNNWQFRQVRDCKFRSVEFMTSPMFLKVNYKLVTLLKALIYEHFTVYTEWGIQKKHVITVTSVFLSFIKHVGV